MNLKKSLIAVIVAAGAIATPALAQLRVNVGFGVPLPPAPVYEVMPPPMYGYAWAPGYWAWAGHRYVWVRGHHVRYGHRHAGYAYGQYR